MAGATSDAVGSLTLLKDGRVLLAGGYTQVPEFAPRLLNSAYVYDPSTGRFSQTGSMTKARARLSTTLLPDGRVLVAGGGDFLWCRAHSCRSSRFQLGGPVQPGNRSVRARAADERGLLRPYSRRFSETAAYSLPAATAGRAAVPACPRPSCTASSPQASLGHVADRRCQEGYRRVAGRGYRGLRPRSPPASRTDPSCHRTASPASRTLGIATVDDQLLVAGSKISALDVRVVTRPLELKPTGPRRPRRPAPCRRRDWPRRASGATLPSRRPWSR